MCGIVGLAGGIGQKDRQIFENMFIFSQVRGPHSSGVASVDRLQNNKVIVAKNIGRPDVLIDYDKRYDKATDYNKKFMLGHNRWATTGKISIRNAHPFEFEHIVGCHNGTVKEHTLRKLREPCDKYGTDSEAILANIDEYPLADVMKPLDGAWALVWYDDRNDSLNFLRNEERRLFYCYSETRKTVYWASESGILAAAIERNDTKLTKIYELPANVHYSWVIPERDKAFDQPKQVEVKSNGVPEWRSVPRFPAATSEIIDLNQFKSSTALSTSSINVKQFEDPKNLKEMDGQGYIERKNKKFYRGFRGEMMTKTLFENVTREGCGWCTTPAEWGKPVRFINSVEHICLDCNGDKEVREICGLRG